MKTLLISLLAAAVLCLPAGAIELPDGLDAAVPQELLEDAMEEGLVARGAAYLWETLRTSFSDALAASLRRSSAVTVEAQRQSAASFTSTSIAKTRRGF